MYDYFDGDFRRRPQQSLGGAQRKVPRQQLLERAAQERRHREELRQQTNCATIIQSFMRGCIVRKHEYSKFRKEFDDKIELITKESEIPTLNTIEYLIHRLIIFYSDKKDSQRLNWLSQQLIKLVNNIVNAIINEANHWLYRMKCILHFNIKHLETTASQQISIAIPMRIMELYTSADIYKSAANSQNANHILSSIWNYLISHGFFRQMRTLIDNKIPEPFESTTKAPTPLSGTLLDLTLRPFKTVKYSNDRIISFFIKNFLNDTLKGPFSSQIKNYVLTSISNDIPENLKADYLIDSLLPKYSCDSITISLSPNIWLLYSSLKLIGTQTPRMNPQYIVKYLHILRCLSSSLSELTKPQLSELHPDLEAEESEAMDTNDSSQQNTLSDASLVEEIISMINEPIHVQAITSLIDVHNIINDSETLISLSCLCHSLLASHPLAVNQYRLLYTLAFKSEFLRVVWKYVTSVSTPSVFGSPTSLLYILSRGLPLAAVKWNQILPELTLFCALFSYLFPTLDDVEFYKDVDSEFYTTNSLSSTMPFTLQELASMGLTLRDVCIGLVELAYHDTRPSVREDYHNALRNGNQSNQNTTDDQKNVMRHWNKLFKSCVKLLRQLYARDSRRQFCPPEHWISKQVSVPVERPTNFRIGAQQRRSMYREFIGLRHLTREELEEHGPPLSTTEVRNVTILQEIPFVVSFHDRVKILQTLISIDRTQHRGDPNTFNIMGNTIQIVIRRNYIYEDAFEKLSPENEPNLKQSLRVQLVSAIGLDEAGIDGGGIFREFLSEVLKTAFDPNRGFFRSTSDSLLYPNPSVTILMENYMKHYYFIGRMLGKAIYENMLVELPFAPFFLAKLLARHSASDIEIHHLASLDRDMYKNLIFLKSYDGDVSELGLDFTTINNDLGTTQVIELKPGGDKITVTAQNRIEYIHLMADYRLNKQIRLHCAAFKQGLADVLDLDWLRMFDPRELQILISGAPTPVDIEDLRKHTNYSGGYNKDHIVITIFWKVVEEFEEQEKRKLLKFVTSCSRPPLLGFKDLYPPFCIQNAGREPTRLPTASTCMNLLKLPEFQDIETMRQKLKYAVDSGSGFELS